MSPPTLISRDYDRSSALAEACHNSLHCCFGDSRMVDQTEEDSFQVIRNQGSQTRLQRRCLAEPVIGVDDYFDSLALDPLLNLLGPVPEHHDDGLEPGRAECLHDQLEECAAVIGECGLGSSHAGGLTRSEDQSGNHTISAGLGRCERE